MSLNKVNYIDQKTVITAQNLNNIQDSILELENSKNFIAIYGETTYEEVKEAYDAGKFIYAKYWDIFVPFQGKSNDGSDYFIFLSPTEITNEDTSGVFELKLSTANDWNYRSINLMSTIGYNDLVGLLLSLQTLHSGDAWKFKGNNSIADKERISISYLTNQFTTNLETANGPDCGESLIKVVDINQDAFEQLSSGAGNLLIPTEQKQIIYFEELPVESTLGSGYLPSMISEFFYSTGASLFPGEYESLIPYDFILSTTGENIVINNQNFSLSPGLWVRFFYDYGNSDSLFSWDTRIRSIAVPGVCLADEFATKADIEEAIGNAIGGSY